ncbi:MULTISPECIES: PaaI family thioesterase [unclassified Parafrankia]|uniref:PaaI family thioesterase n=1 Tax=unclassified Parafrankia TaxID=2994368 RepID=UPI000DA4BE85|nr:MULTISPECIES: PaaI family thioesterase [unclassified Parafrankia]SQD97323.1 Thioesterase superfamily protein [Parafrankia sp. Ea1.12]
MTEYRADLPPDLTVPERHPEAPAAGVELPSHYVRCFGCGSGEPDGLHLRAFAGPGLTLQARFDVTEHHQGAPGLGHGGLLTCALDETLGLLSHLTRTSRVTARLETDFRRPVPVGSTLFIDARVDGVSGRKSYVSAEGRLDTADGPVAVQVRGVFVEVTLQHFITHARADEVRAIEQDPGLVDLGDYTVNP